MAGQCVARLAVWISLAGIAVPVLAQQPSLPGQSTPVPQKPGTPPEQGTQPGAKPAVPPMRVPGEVPAAPQGAAPGASRETPAPQAAPARRPVPPPPSPSGMVSLNFNRADLVEIIHIIAQQLRLTYTIDPEVKGTVTINSAEPLRSEDLLPIFHQVLRMNGAVAVRTGNLYHIMPIKDGKGLARPVGQSREDSFALQVVPVRFFAVAEMKRVLTPFLRPGGEIIEHPRGNFLIIMDLASNIQRLVEIADLIDVQVFAGTRMEIYQPKIASAEELAQEMTKVMQSFAASAPQGENFVAQFVALPRINQLLVISHSEAAWTYAKRWLDRIDVVAEGPGRRIFIYPVENGKATELADVLSQALGHPSTGRRDTTRTLQDLHRSTPTGGASGIQGRGLAPSPFGSTGAANQPSLGPLGAYATIPVPPGQAAPPTPPQPGVVPAPGVARPAPQPPSAQQQMQEQLRIVPDPATNSLIIYGTVQEFQNIKNILKELDAIPRQVLIEAMVLQVDLNDTESLGVDFEILRRSRVTIFGQTFNSRGALRSLGDKFPVPPAFGGGSGLSGVFGGSDVQALVNALMTDSRVKLLSSPSVLAADNRPARIQVGSEEPIPTGTITAAVGAVTPSSSTTIQYRNTGRILTIIPQVNSKGLVNLQIKAEVSQRGEDVPFGSGETFPSFNTQDAETTAVVHDGETLVIGGLIGERKSKTRSGVPYLMDIPVFGRFFGTTGEENRRTELIMLITPYVIRNQSEAQSVTEEFKAKVEKVRNELERIERDRARSRPPASPDNQNPIAPGRNELKPPPPTSRNRGAGTGASLPVSESALASLTAFPAADSSDWSRTQMPDPPPLQPAQTAASEAPPPAYIMSVAKQAPALPAPAVKKPAVRADMSPPPPVSEAPREAKPRRQWGVQVAALADRKDAEQMVVDLRQAGYDAYLITGQIDNKTWHRVRVGHFAEVSAAKLLREALIDNGRFKQAYVAANN